MIFRLGSSSSLYTCAHVYAVFKTSKVHIPLKNEVLLNIIKFEFIHHRSKPYLHYEDQNLMLFGI
jgi:hypothetical protein